MLNLVSDEISKIEIIYSGINSKTAIATDRKKKSILKIYPAEVCITVFRQNLRVY